MGVNNHRVLESFVQFVHEEPISFKLMIIDLTLKRHFARACRTFVGMKPRIETRIRGSISPSGGRVGGSRAEILCPCSAGPGPDSRLDARLSKNDVRRDVGVLDNGLSAVASPGSPPSTSLLEFLENPSPLVRRQRLARLRHEGPAGSRRGEGASGTLQGDIHDRIAGREARGNTHTHTHCSSRNHPLRKCSQEGPPERPRRQRQRRRSGG